MKSFLSILILLPAICAAAQTAAPSFDVKVAERFARLALACVHKEYPNKISHVLNSDADVAPPRKLTPAFCGCYDWHSSVHGHWMLVRLLRSYPDLSTAPEIRHRLEAHLTDEAMATEARYLDRSSARSFERTYGWAWILRVAAELEAWDDPQAKAWRERIRSLEDA